ncbi:MAG: SulP family inorganic anion transporter [Nitrospirota bacterium]|nr:SulP family inorganic anion transporter [Nitrospirota bacterium]
MSSHEPMTPTMEKPRNGIRGLKHWRYDLLAGLQVALIGLPLSLGIAVASGAPPITGVISAIIAGLVFPFLGGAYVTISGPAAGLAPALLAGMIALGHGDLAVGYPLLLVAICLTGVVQVLLSLLRAGSFALYFPISVVEGMLSAIGILIIIKQIPQLLGDQLPPVKSIPAAILAIPHDIQKMNPEIFLVGGLALALLFFLSSRTERWATLIPAPLLVVSLGGIASWLLQLPQEYLVHIPLDIFQHGIHFPHFSEAWQNQDLWMAFLVTIVTLTLIDGTESLATIAAVDKIDPFHRKSDPNVTLRAMGISNILSSLAGGLTIIPGGVKSTTNIMAGGRTLWANFYYACSLALLLWFGTRLINLTPLSVLAALLIWIGWQLCAPRVFQKMLAIGKEQLLIAMVTVVVTLYTSDLLEGVALGTLTKVIVLCIDLVRASAQEAPSGESPFRRAARLLPAALTELFSNPVIRIGDGRGSRERYSVMTVATSAIRGTVGEMKNPYKIYLSSVTCMNLMKLDKALHETLVVPPNSKANFLIILAGQVIDHTSMEYLHHFQDQCIEAGHTCAIVGVDHFRAFSDHVLAYRVNPPRNLMAFA